jgi:hypothetical protein
MKELPLYNVCQCSARSSSPSNNEQLCAGDLGTDVEHLERNLVEITLLAYKWRAIILIDEADVYLAERSL